MPIPGDDRVRRSNLVQGDLVERESLVVREGRRLSRRSGDDEAVGAVLDQVPAERPESLQLDRAVGSKRRRDRGENLAEHSLIVTLIALRYDCRLTHRPEEASCCASSEIS